MEVPAPLPLGDALRAARVRRGVSQWDLADRSGVSRSSIARAELESHVPDMATLMRLCGALRCALIIDPRGVTMHALEEADDA